MNQIHPVVRDQIKEIIFDKKLNMIDRLIKIDKLISGEDWDPEKLSKALELPLSAIIEEPEPLLIPIKEKPKSDIKEYIDSFASVYLKIKGEKFRFMGADIGQVKNIMKGSSVTEFKRIMAFLLSVHSAKGLKPEFEVKNILQNLKPSRIYSNLNYLITESGKSTHSWGYGIGGKK